MFRSRTVSLALVALFVWLTGCTTYNQIELGELVDHGKVRVTLIDGQRQTILDPVIEADSIRGRENVARSNRHEVTPLVIPLSQVSTLEASRVSGPLTGGLVVGVILGLFAFAGIVTCAEGC